MTNQADTSGPSLFQARKTTRHNHNHNHLHLHQHRRLHSHAHADEGTTPHIRSPPTEKSHDRRQEVVVVQTVSVVHYIDGAGSVTSVSTLRSDPDPDSDPVAPTSLDSPAGVTAGLPAVGDALPSVSLSGLIPDLSDVAPSTTTSAEPEPEPSSSSLSASLETLTSAPFTSSSAFPTLSSGIFNSSSIHLPSSSLFTNSSIALFKNTTRTSFSSHSTFASSTTTTTSSRSSTRLTSTTSDVASIVAGSPGGDGDAGAGAGAETTESASPASGSSPDSGSGSGLAPETRNAVVGGIVGSVAGIALIVFALLFFLKWRKQQGRGIMLLGDGDSTARGRGFPSNKPAGPSSGGGMAERSGAFAIPAALASLTGSKRAIEAAPAGPATQEKGFYRVSGKKLVSVLESGGDGYSDPHDSIGSRTSYFRDSQAYLDDPNQSHLQLGSPMRPVSGVVVMRDGPQRTAVQEHEQLHPGYRRSAFPTMLPVPDQVGRSFAARDGSHGSGSRFTEDA